MIWASEVDAEVSEVAVGRRSPGRSETVAAGSGAGGGEAVQGCG